jgi:hypothetical protein
LRADIFSCLAIGHDVVVAPGFSLDGTSSDGAEITEVLNSDKSFDSILEDMKAGNSGSGSFSYGPSQDMVYIDYAPVSSNALTPLVSPVIFHTLTMILFGFPLYKRLSSRTFFLLIVLICLVVCQMKLPWCTHSDL